MICRFQIQDSWAGKFANNAYAERACQSKVLHCAALCCNVLQCVAMYCTVLHGVARCCTVLHSVTTNVRKKAYVERAWR